jgi:peptide/nickel transport system ATP-binding protein
MTPVFQIEGLCKTYGNSGWLQRGRVVHALRGIQLTVHAGSTLGIVGESGSGKSTLARILVGLDQAFSGKVVLEGRDLKQCLRDRRNFHRKVQFVFQNSYAALNPRKRIGSTLLNHLLSLGEPSVEAARARVREVSREVDLSEDLLGRYPHALSGGQAQRVNLARALLSRPEVILMDEPVSALDVSVQARILRLLRRLSEAQSFTLIFITHDLAVVDYLCQDVCVMHRGKIVEQGKTTDILNHPAQDYTRELIAASRATAMIPS